VLGLPAPNDGDGPDTMAWEGTNTHRFTVQSAYSLQFGDIPAQEGDWKSLCMGLERTSSYTNFYMVGSS
jgi:hypothetical protein